MCRSRIKKGQLIAVEPESSAENFLAGGAMSFSDCMPRGSQS